MAHLFRPGGGCRAGRRRGRHRDQIDARNTRRAAFGPEGLQRRAPRSTPCGSDTRCGAEAAERRRGISGHNIFKETLGRRVCAAIAPGRQRQEGAGANGHYDIQDGGSAIVEKKYKKKSEILPIKKIVVILHPLSIVGASPVPYPFKLATQYVRREYHAVRCGRKSRKRGNPSLILGIKTGSGGTKKF